MDSTEIAIRNEQTLQHEMSVKDVQRQVQKIQEVMRSLMQEREHYGTIPGTDKPTLYKAGAEKMCLMFRYDPEYDVEESTVSDKLIYYRVKCTLYHIPTGLKVASGLGSCNSRENKYRWRKGDLACPECGSVGPFMRSKHQPEWFCWAKKGGCGATFPLDAVEAPGRVENDNPYNEDNTLLKMACKRALVAAVLNGTAASDIFTQDLEELVDNGVIQAEESKQEPKEEQPKQKSETPNKMTVGQLKELQSLAEQPLPEDTKVWVEKAITKGISGPAASRLIEKAKGELETSMEDASMDIESDPLENPEEVPF